MHDWIKKLKLERHVEGGYFGLFYKSLDLVTVSNERYQGRERSAGSSIYFLLEKQDFSAWHQLKSDEIWHYYDGEGVVDLHTMDHHGDYTLKILGHPRLAKNAEFQVVIPAGTWFAAELQNKQSYALVGCTVSPGFEYGDFELGEREDLTRQFPKHKELIHRLTRSTAETCHPFE